MRLLSTSEKKPTHTMNFKAFPDPLVSIVSLIFFLSDSSEFRFISYVSFAKLARQSICLANCPNFQLINQSINEFFMNTFSITHYHTVVIVVVFVICFLFSFGVCLAFFNFIMSI